MKDPRFFEGVDPAELAAAYGTPLYIYNERVFRTRCREMKNLVSYPNFRVNYSVITPEPFVCLPAEYCRKSSICGDYAVVSITVTVSFADNRTAVNACIKPVNSCLIRFQITCICGVHHMTCIFINISSSIQSLISFAF